jgi:hypothetical protein
VCVCVCVCVCVSYINTYIHTYIHTYMCILLLNLCTIVGASGEEVLVRGAETAPKNSLSVSHLKFVNPSKSPATEAKYTCNY